MTKNQKTILWIAIAIVAIWGIYTIYANRQVSSMQASNPRPTTPVKGGVGAAERVSLTDGVLVGGKLVTEVTRRWNGGTGRWEIMSNGSWSDAGSDLNTRWGRWDTSASNCQLLEMEAKKLYNIMISTFKFGEATPFGQYQGSGLSSAANPIMQSAVSKYNNSVKVWLDCMSGSSYINNPQAIFIQQPVINPIPTPAPAPAPSPMPAPSTPNRPVRG